MRKLFPPGMLVYLLYWMCSCLCIFAAPNKHTTAVAIYANIRGANLNAPFGATQAIILLISASVCLYLGHLLNRRAEGR